MLNCVEWEVNGELYERKGHWPIICTIV
jgi:hypothetical protein